jgi:hypothetical protein
MYAANPRTARAAGMFRIRHDGSIVASNRKSRDSVSIHSIALSDRTYADSDGYLGDHSGAATEVPPSTVSTASPVYAPSYQSHYAPASSGGCCGCGHSPSGPPVKCLRSYF